MFLCTFIDHIRALTDAVRKCLEIDVIIIFPFSYGAELGH